MRIDSGTIQFPSVCCPAYFVDIWDHERTVNPVTKEIRYTYKMVQSIVRYQWWEIVGELSRLGYDNIGVSKPSSLQEVK